jgi:hypothetical protein
MRTKRPWLMIQEHLSSLMNTQNLTWVLQSNAIGKDDQSSLTESIMKLGHKVEFLRVIPFIHEPADALPEISGSCIVYGSSGLVKLGHAANWLPCGWDGEAFELDVVNKSLGATALNFDAIKTVWSNTFETASMHGWETVFVRPVSETKEFPGRVFETDQLREWVEKLRTSGYFETNDNPAMIGPALKLGREWRVFVVNGQQVSGCEYANRGIPKTYALLPNEVADFVEKTLQVYTPAPCFVIDVAEVFANGTNALKVVEYNSINSAGFYACNTAAVVDALSQFALSDMGQ